MMIKILTREKTKLSDGENSWVGLLSRRARGIMNEDDDEIVFGGRLSSLRVSRFGVRECLKEMG